MRASLLLLLLLACAAVTLTATCMQVEAAAQTCVDENGEAVDWFIIVKLPRLTASNDPRIQVGTAYMYADARSNGATNFWRNSSKEITDATSSVGRTIQQIYDGSSSLSNGWLMYNDDTPTPSGASSSFAHAKGIMGWNAGGGFWLIHSVPKYSESPNNGAKSYLYPKSGQENGQSMLCVSLDVANVDQVFLQMQYTNPQVYGSQWVAALTSKMPQGDRFLNNKLVYKTAVSHVTNLTTVGGKLFTHFAKTASWGQSIFGNLIGPYFHRNILAETWQRPYETPLLPPNTLQSVYSVLNVQTPYYAFAQTNWKMTQDHAKWCISTDPSVPLLCIGDINKQKSQWVRSGGMLCVVDSGMYGAFQKMVLKTDQGGLAEADRLALEMPEEVEKIALE